MSFAQQEFSSLTAAIASSSPVPGGGTAAALTGAMAAALVEMVANLTIGRKKHQSVQEVMLQLSSTAQALRLQFETLATEDAKAYELVMAAYKLPKEGDSEQRHRQEAIAEALQRAAVVPLQTATAALSVLELATIVEVQGNTNAQTDAKVAKLLSSAAMHGALLNVEVNLQGLTPLPDWAEEFASQCQELRARERTINAPTQIS